MPNHIIIKQEMIQPNFTPFTSNATSRGFCSICYNSYDFDKKKPLLICEKDHTICKMCLLAIRERLRCPFCRSAIHLDRIRVSKIVVSYLRERQKKIGEQQFKKSHASRKQQKIQKFITNNTVPDDSSIDDNIYLDPAQFMPEIHELEYEMEIQRNNINRQRRVQKVIKIIIYIQLVVLQLPFGIISLYIGLNEPKNTYFDQYLPQTSVNLRNTLLTLGYLEMLTGVLTIYFQIIKCMNIMMQQGLNCFHLFLLCMCEIKSFFGFFIYTKFLVADMIRLYSPQIQNFAKATIIVNDLQLIIGIFLICHYMDRVFDYQY